MERTPVVFYRDPKKNGGDVFAVFPHFVGDEDPHTMTCYTHVGQHSVCHRDYLRGCSLASPEEYQPLLREMVGIYEDSHDILFGKPVELVPGPMPRNSRAVRYRILEEMKEI